MRKNNIQSSGANVYIKGHRCYLCGHEWKPNSMQKLSKVCPKCKSPYWDKPKTNGKLKRAKNYYKATIKTLTK